MLVWGRRPTLRQQRIQVFLKFQICLRTLYQNIWQKSTPMNLVCYRTVSLSPKLGPVENCGSLDSQTSRSLLWSPFPFHCVFTALGGPFPRWVGVVTVSGHLFVWAVVFLSRGENNSSDARGESQPKRPSWTASLWTVVWADCNWPASVL